jgi:hypothetical protein
MKGKTIEFIDTLYIQGTDDENFYSIMKMTDGSAYMLCSIGYCSYQGNLISIYSDNKRINELIVSKIDACDIRDTSCDKNYVLLTNEEFLHFMEFIRKIRQRKL